MKEGEQPQFQERQDPQRGIFLCAEWKSRLIWMVAIMYALAPRGENYSNPIMVWFSNN